MKVGKVNLELIAKILRKKEISIGGAYQEVLYSPIMSNEFSYILAQKFCYLTGIEGYTS